MLVVKWQIWHFVCLPVTIKWLHRSFLRSCPIFYSMLFIQFFSATGFSNSGIARPLLFFMHHAVAPPPQVTLFCAGISR